MIPFGCATMSAAATSAADRLVGVNDGADSAQVSVETSTHDATAWTTTTVAVSRRWIG
jgi:hypothetical protein